MTAFECRLLISSMMENQVNTNSFIKSLMSKIECLEQENRELKYINRKKFEKNNEYYNEY